MMEQAYGFDKQGVDAIRQTVNAVLGTPINAVGQKRGHRAPPGPGGKTAYTGPWAVVRKNDASVTVKAQGEGYPCVSRVIAGLITAVHSTDADVTISYAGEVYLHVTVSGSTYALAFANAATLPAQTDGNYYVSLARVEFADSKIGTITQIKTSDVEVVGRFV